MRIEARAAGSEGSKPSRAPGRAPRMAERRPERPLEHQSSEPVRMALGASSVSFQVSRLTDRTARAWGQGVPQAVVALRTLPADRHGRTSPREPHRESPDWSGSTPTGRVLAPQFRRLSFSRDYYSSTSGDFSALPKHRAAIKRARKQP